MGTLGRKPYLIKWVIVCTDKSNGGSGIRCLSKLNRHSNINGIGILGRKKRDGVIEK